jgi:hypothetical protein
MRRMYWLSDHEWLIVCGYPANTCQAAIDGAPDKYCLQSEAVQCDSRFASLRPHLV